MVFRAPSGPAAREIATRELRSEWSISKPARALRTLRRPPHRRRSRNSRLSLLLAAPLVFQAPSGPAAREIATREPKGALRILGCGGVVLAWGRGLPDD